MNSIPGFPVWGLGGCIGGRFGVVGGMKDCKSRSRMFSPMPQA